MDNVHTTL